jgi:hypothetical protein
MAILGRRPWLPVESNLVLGGPENRMPVPMPPEESLVSCSLVLGVHGNTAGTKVMTLPVPMNRAHLRRRV